MVDYFESIIGKGELMDESIKAFMSLKKAMMKYQLEATIIRSEDR